MVGSGCLSYKYSSSSSWKPPHPRMALVSSQTSTSSNCTSTLKFSHDVFLNFRGEDTRYGFTGNLYSALIQKGIKTFIDDEGLRKGDEISLALVKAIEESRVALIVFSPNYAASRWCLDELCKILDCMKLRQQLVVPVFYKIDPSIVRNQTGVYEKSMTAHRKKWRENKEKVRQWSSALYQAANLSGWHFEFGYEFQFIQNIVEDISRRLHDPIFLESQTSQVILQGLEFKNDVGNKEHYEVAAAPASSKEVNGKSEASNGIIKRLVLFFGYSSRRPDAEAEAQAKAGPKAESESGVEAETDSEAEAAASTSSTKVRNSKSEEIKVGTKKLVFFDNSSRYDLDYLLRGSPEVLGKGSIGTTYKAVLEDGTVLAVKRLKGVNIFEREFKEKMESLGAMAHENLVPLQGYYFSEDEKLLFYDYMPMGSLAALLHDSKGKTGRSRTLLSWETRLGIALGVAGGIEYLHSQGPNVCHGNIKSSNILLTTSFEGHLSDFGLSLLADPASTPNRVSGYRAPEVTDPRKVSQKSDVYSFGVLLLELLTGKAPINSLLNEDGVDLLRWVKFIERKEWSYEFIDIDMLRYGKVDEEKVELLVQLALDCTANYHVNRPFISEVKSKWMRCY